MVPRAGVLLSDGVDDVAVTALCQGLDGPGCSVGTTLPSGAAYGHTTTSTTDTVQ